MMNKDKKNHRTKISTKAKLFLHLYILQLYILFNAPNFIKINFNYKLYYFIYLTKY